MKTHQDSTLEPAGTLPSLHLVVPPEGEHASIQQALEQFADRLVLRWRLDAGALKLVAHAELRELLAEGLLGGGQVSVWHGAMALDPSYLEQCLGSQWSSLCTDRLTWTRIRRVDTPGVRPWTVLAERLDRPDEPVVRQMFFSDGQRLPSWPGLSSALNLQARIAHAAWYQLHLEPLQAAIDEFNEEAAPSSNNATPAKGNATSTELESAGVGDSDWDSGLPTARDSGPRLADPGDLRDMGNHRASSYRMQASSVLSAAGLDNAPRTQTATLSAVLSPVASSVSAPRWLARQWVKNGLVYQGAPPPRVDLSYDDLRAVCRVRVVLPAQPRKAQWRLCLYPSSGAPINLRFASDPGQTEAQPAWPKAADLTPDDMLWDAIQSGQVGLDLLPEAPTQAA